MNTNDVVVFEQYAYTTNGDDGEWDENPAWRANNNLPFSSFEKSNEIGYDAIYCAAVKDGRNGNRFLALSTPMYSSEKFTIDFWIHQKERSNGFIQIGVCQNVYSRDNRGLMISVDKNERNGDWYLNYWDHIIRQGVTNRIRLTYDSDRWINMILKRDEDGFWQVIWDKNGSNEYSFRMLDSFEDLSNPYLW